MTWHGRDRWSRRPQRRSCWPPPPSQPVAAAHRNEGQLIILDQPAMTGVGLPVLTASGGPLRVAVIDKSGQRVRQAGVKVRIVLFGTTGCLRNNVKTTKPSGVARFRPRISCEGLGHRLRARHVATPAIPHVHKSGFSASFDVLGSTLCGDSCAATVSKDGTDVRVSSATGTRVLLTAGGPGEDCVDYNETSEPVTIDVTESSTRTTVRFAVPYAGRASSTYQVCFSSPVSSFTDRSDTAIAAGEAGLLKDCHAHYRVVVEHARLAGDLSMEQRLLPALASCAQLGPTPVPQAIAIVEDVLERIRADRKSEAYTLRVLANLEAMRGRFIEARSLYRRSRDTLEQLGWRFDAALTSAIASGPVELIAGDAEGAEAELRRDYETLGAMGERNYISTTAAFLAEALYRQGRDAEAMAMTEESESIADDEDVATQYLWRSVRAKLLARQGQFADAEDLARAAIAIIESAQDPDSQGYAWLDFAEVLIMAGRSAQAVEAADEAIRLFEVKANAESGARARAARARAMGAPSDG